MKTSLPTTALLLLSLLAHAQEASISGRVIDGATKAAIPFASIAWLKAGTGALTNENGYFKLASAVRGEQDSLVLMTLGYQRRAVLAGPAEGENLQVELTRRPAWSVTSCPVGNYTAGNALPGTKDEVIVGLPGTQYAFFIDNDKRKQTRKMLSVSFYLGENGLPVTSFRIRLYRAGGSRHAPGPDLLAEQVFLTPSRSGQWHTCDLSRYNVTVPKEGYFVALEFEKPANASPQVDQDSYTPSGQIMRPPFDFKDSSIWSYAAEKGWTLFPQSTSSRRYSAMVKVEVEPDN